MNDSLEYRVAQLERIVLAGSGDRLLGLREIAAGLNRSIHTLRAWTKSGAKRTQYGVDRFMRQDATGRWCCSASELQKWRFWLAAGGGR